MSATAVRGDAFLRLGLQNWSQPREDGLIGRCLRTKRPVLIDDVTAQPDYHPTAETVDVRSELVVPLWVGEELWGVINIEELEPGAFGEDDVRLVETVADQVGAALRSASLYEQLERAYLGTAQALVAALEAKDAYTAEHARSIVEQAEKVGVRLGLDDAALRDLRFAAVFHDIGKISVPEAILSKPGPLTPEEREIMERHTIVGEQILAPVEFLAGVRALVRHEHERWDGAGYPDRLAGEAIPLGSRIIFACDALHAMTSDRPYRAALPLEDAIAELRRHSGTQFDPQVVEALLAVLDESPMPALMDSRALPPASLSRPCPVVSSPRSSRSSPCSPFPPQPRRPRPSPRTTSRSATPTPPATSASRRPPRRRPATGSPTSSSARPASAATTSSSSTSAAGARPASRSSSARPSAAASAPAAWTTPARPRRPPPRGSCASTSGQVKLITVSIGGNDVTSCAKEADPVACVGPAMEKVKANGKVLLKRLRKAAGPKTRIVGITYPDVILGAWVGENPNQDLAKLSVVAFQSLLNPALKEMYESVKGTLRRRHQGHRRLHAAGADDDARPLRRDPRRRRRGLQAHRLLRLPRHPPEQQGLRGHRGPDREDAPAQALMAAREDVRFPSGEADCAGWLYPGRRDELAARRGRAPVRIPAAGPPGSPAMMTAPDALPGVEALTAGHDVDSTATARVGTRVGLYRPGRALRRPHPPTLMCVCDQDSVAPARAAIRHAERGRDVELRRYPIGHFEIYWGEWFERAVADQLGFLRLHLNP